MNKIIETHCHLDYLKQASLEEILKKSDEAGIKKILTIAVDPNNLDKAFELSKAYENVYFTQGIHPHDAKDMNELALQKIEARTKEAKMLAIGEIGLDYHYDNSPRDVQKSVFKDQLAMAIKCKKPVVIHSRDADEDMISILKEYTPKLVRKGVIHSFTSTKALAEVALDLGFYLGFNGIITFKKAEDVRDIVRLAPIERILIETDSPFLTPVPHRGKENAPFYLPFIAEKIAEIKSIPVEDVIRITTKNAENLFDF